MPDDLALSLEPIPSSQAGLLANLLELYIYDFSELLGLKPGPDGRFGYQGLEAWWQAPGHYPLLIRAGDGPAGFAMVRRGSRCGGGPDVWDMAEFFVLRGSRRLGLGAGAAAQVWQRFQGPWEVRVMERNGAARAFWARAIAAWAGRDVSPRAYAQAGESWAVFSFESPGQAGECA